MSVSKQLKEFDINGHVSLILDHHIRVIVSKKPTGGLGLYVQFPDGVSVLTEGEYWQRQAGRKLNNNKKASVT